jgi:beta-N-acetylhexosaminidase
MWQLARLAVCLWLASFLPLLAVAPKKPSKSAQAKSAPAKSPAKKSPAAGSQSLTESAIAARWMKSLTLREKVAQLVVVQFNGRPQNPRSRDGRKFANLMAREHVGGLVLINTPNGRPGNRADPFEVAGFLNSLQSAAKVPLIVAGDFERGVSMRVDLTTIFPHAMAFTATGDSNLARQEGEITAKEARALGFHWIFFPDADVNNNPDNPIINIRSYGENPSDVSRMVTAFIEGAHSAKGPRVLVTAKHFPGHGDTATDTHFNLATIQGDRARLEQVEWVPFRAAIQSGVDSVMSAHLSVPAVENPELPATLSPKLLTGILRGEMGFKGLIVTDALQMGGIAHGFTVGETAVRALEAGADVLLMPSDPVVAINGVMAALKSGRLTAKRIEDSVSRLLAAKARLGLGTKKLVDIEAIRALIDTEESNAVARQVADRSVTLLRNQNQAVPLKSPQSTAFFLLAERRGSVEGEAMAAELLRRVPGAMIVPLDAGMSETELQTAVQNAADATLYVVAAFASVAAFRGNVPLGGALPQMVQSLIATKKPVVMVALGNPYLLRTFPDVAGYLTGFSTVPPSEVAAVKALFGEIPIRGKLPVTIPGYAKYGDGMVLPGPSAR